LSVSRVRPSNETIRSLWGGVGSKENRVNSCIVTRGTPHQKGADPCHVEQWSCVPPPQWGLSDVGSLPHIFICLSSPTDRPRPPINLSGPAFLSPSTDRYPTAYQPSARVDYHSLVQHIIRFIVNRFIVNRFIVTHRFYNPV